MNNPVRGYVNSPAWVKDLIIYEIATKGFTSPNGPETGTFKGVQDRLPYLQDLGINGIWLTGHSLSHPTHFYNIWTQYAVIEPDKIDPSLGTEQDFRDLIDAAHRRGIRVFLDVITHGVMNDSPLIAQHPDWFRGQSWGMTDYDFDAHNPELDQWWVDIWTRYIVEFGVDGYRLDLGMRRPDLWARIRENANAAGRSVVFIAELGYDGAKAFVEQSGLTEYPPLEVFQKVIDFAQRDARTMLDPHPFLPEINATAGKAHAWGVAEWEKWLDNALGAGTPEWAWSCAQLSCHDDGWEGFTGENPYVAQGSRFIFGYGALFSGMVPIFMAGEEFDAVYTPLPTLSPNLFGGADPGKGKWLYGGMLQWDALEKPRHRAMLADVKKLIAIRKQEADALAAAPNDAPKNILRVPFTSDIPCPSPYVRWADGKAVVVAGNPSSDTEATLSLSIPLAAINLAGYARYRVTDLWTGAAEIVDEAALARLGCPVPRDKTPGGGVRVLKIEPA